MHLLEGAIEIGVLQEMGGPHFHTTAVRQRRAASIEIHHDVRKVAAIRYLRRAPGEVVDADKARGLIEAAAEIDPDLAAGIRIFRQQRLDVVGGKEPVIRIGHRRFAQSTNSPKLVKNSSTWPNSLNFAK